MGRTGTVKLTDIGQGRVGNLSFTPLQLERYHARFEWPAISFRGTWWMAFRGVEDGTGWLWDRGWKESAAIGQAI